MLINCPALGPTLCRHLYTGVGSVLQVAVPTTKSDIHSEHILDITVLLLGGWRGVPLMCKHYSGYATVSHQLHS